MKSTGGVKEYLKTIVAQVVKRPVRGDGVHLCQNGPAVTIVELS